jgi:hypothetical protein
MLLSYHQNVGQNHYVKTANKSFENVAQFIYLGMTVTNQNLIQEEIRKRLNLGNGCYHSVENFLFSCQLSKNIKIRIYETIIVPVVSYRCETWPLTLSEEYQNRVLRKIFGQKWDAVIGGWQKLHTEKLYDLYSLPSIITMIMSRRMRWAGHVA